MEKLTLEWQEYDGDYEKHVQDIRLKDGTELIGCYPNANKWVHFNSDLDFIPNDQITHVRLTHDREISTDES